jgi:hypothetical protein
MPSPISVLGSVMTNPAASATTGTVSTTMQVSIRVANVLVMSSLLSRYLSAMRAAFAVPNYSQPKVPMFLEYVARTVILWKRNSLRKFS